jgi:RHS repeat-associated protein
LTGATSPDGSVQYTYDATGQLTGADYTVGAGQGAAAGLPTEPPPDETYSYDANGNRTTVATGGSPVTYITGPNNEVLFDGTYRYTYDPEGNRTARFIWTDADADGQVDSGERSQITDYAWDNRNRLVSVTDYATDGGPATQVVHYSYDTHNRWISRTLDPDGAGTQSADATYFVYDGNQIVLTFADPDGPSGSSSPTLANRLLWGPAVDQLLADEQLSPLPPGEGQGEGRLLFPLTDHLGTIRDLAEFDAATGITAIVNHRVFDAYGQLLAETNAAVDCLFAFTGRPFDEATGLQYNLHRWYDSRLGRWLSQDPIGFAAGDTNTQRYCRNSTTNLTDPSGLFPGTGVYRIFLAPFFARRATGTGVAPLLGVVVFITNRTSKDDKPENYHHEFGAKVAVHPGIASLSQLLKEIDKYPDGSIQHLIISGHRSPQGCGVAVMDGVNAGARIPWPDGRTIGLDEQQVPLHITPVNILGENAERIRRKLAPGALVEIRSCRAAENVASQLRLARNLQATVQASTGATWNELVDGVWTLTHDGEWIPVAPNGPPEDLP